MLLDIPEKLIISEKGFISTKSHVIEIACLEKSCLTF